MKVKDMVTGNILESDNLIVVGSWESNPERFLTAIEFIEIKETKQPDIKLKNVKSEKIIPEPEEGANNVYPIS